MNKWQAREELLGTVEEPLFRIGMGRVRGASIIELAKAIVLQWEQAEAELMAAQALLMRNGYPYGREPEAMTTVAVGK